MTKWDRFYDAVCESVIYPFVISFVVCVTMLVASIATNKELLVLGIITVIILAVTAVWAVVWLICITIDKVIEHNNSIRERWKNFDIDEPFADEEESLND